MEEPWEEEPWGQTLQGRRSSSDGSQTGVAHAEPVFCGEVPMATANWKGQHPSGRVRTMNGEIFQIRFLPLNASTSRRFLVECVGW